MLTQKNCLLCNQQFISRKDKLYCGSRTSKESCTYKAKLKNQVKYHFKYRHSPAYQEWKVKRKTAGHYASRINQKQKLRLKALTRDNYTCQICYTHNPNIHFFDVDHKDSNRNNNNLDNLWTLCPNCHRLKTIKDREQKVGSWADWMPLQTKAIVIYQPKPIIAWKQGYGA